MTQALSGRVGRPKSEVKRQQILSAAKTLFLTEGVTNTSMDNVAKKSGVSKQTVYSHFANKDELYKAAIESKCLEYQLDPRSLETSDLPIEQALVQLGVQILKLLHDPQVIAMYRIVIGEAKNTPHVAELFYEAGPRASLVQLAALLVQKSKHTLCKDTAFSLAVDFMNLLKGEFHIRCLFDIAQPMSDAQIMTAARSATSKFLLIFRAASRRSTNIDITGVDVRDK